MEVVLFFCLAFSFHYSAIAVVPFWFLRKVNITKLSPVKLFIGCVSFLAIVKLLFDFAMSFLPRFKAYEGGQDNNIVPFAFIFSLLSLLFINGAYKKAFTALDRNLLLFMVYSCFLCVATLGIL